ncbi:MAG: hypothetical protein H7312_21610 [Tardiphaga sp.]|nr:hypothetical protein [Tardiphaga sp.]
MNYPFVPLFAPRIRVIDSSLEPRLAPAAFDDGPAPIPGGQPGGTRRLHTNATVAAVRRLIEDTTLSCRQIAAQTGVSHSTIARWVAKHGWQRHPYAPLANDSVPAGRAGRRRQLRGLAVKLHALAERCVVELWNDPAVDGDRLIRALRAMKAVRPDALGHRRPRSRPDTRPRTGAEWPDREAAIRKALARQRRDSARIDRVPEQAMAMVAEGHKLPKRAPRARST